MPIAKYEGQTFKKKLFRLEECWFVNCVLYECVIFYSGGSYELENTTFNQCQWKFQGKAASAAQLLAVIGMIPAGQIPPQQIQATKTMN